MLGWIGSAINSGFGLGKQYLANKGRVADAEVAYKLALLEAKTKSASADHEREMEVLRQTGGLDYLNVQQQARSWWDNFLSLLALAPLVLICYGVAVSVPPEQWGWNILMAFANIPTPYLILIGLIYINYLGFRGLFRAALKIWGKKIFDFSFKPKEGKSDGNERADQADGRK